MPEARFVFAQFCDDVRHEIGNKFSLMGCYAGELIVDKLPTVLPKLCTQINVLTPTDRPFSRLLIRATLNSELLAELEYPEDQLVVKNPMSESRWLGVMAIMAFGPLAISEPCKLSIEAETEEGILLGNALSIRERTPQDPPIQGPAKL